MKTFCLSLTFLLLISGCTGVPDLTGDQEIAAAAVYQSCLVCHSMQESAQKGPRLEGMAFWYLHSQLNRFDGDLRGHNPGNSSEHLMGVALEQLSVETDLELLAAYISRLPAQAHLPAVRGDAGAGAALYAACAACHGDSGQGKRLMKAPDLAGLEDWYVLDQLRKFKSGLRGSHPDDAAGQTMAGAMKAVDDEHLSDLVAYIRSLGSAGTQSPR